MCGLTLLTTMEYSKYNVGYYFQFQCTYIHIHNIIDLNELYHDGIFKYNVGYYFQFQYTYVHIHNLNELFAEMQIYCTLVFSFTLCS